VLFWIGLFTLCIVFDLCIAVPYRVSSVYCVVFHVWVLSFVFLFVVGFFIPCMKNGLFL
jgi:hypothetical protein